MSDHELLTYKEIADRLGIKLASVRQTVSRRGWKRIKGNDGVIRIEVPIVYLQRQSSPVDVGAEIKVDVDTTVEMAALKAENSYLSKRVADLEVDRDAWKALANRSWWRRLVGG